jgi:hypothetical protein
MHESLSGLKLGKWLVGEEFKKNNRLFYKCTCDCGNKKDVSRNSLLNGNSKSCGCYVSQLISSRFSKDYTNQRFNNLIAIERLPNYKNSKTYYKCKCVCGNERIVYSNDLTSGKVKMCHECAEKERVKNRRNDYTGQKFGKLYIKKMIYKNKERTKALCLCECGNEKIIDIQNILNGHTQSCGCYEEESRFNREHLIDIKENKYGQLITIRPTDRRTSNGSVIWECKCDCGNIAYISASNLMRNKTLSCGCRKNSKWEEFIDSYLHSLGLQFEREKRFKDCMNIQKSDMLPFDFYIPKYNLIIEYDGLHHFEPISYWGGEEKFEITQRNDSIKNNYCLSHNITILRLPYTLNEKEIIEKIQNILNP